MQLLLLPIKQGLVIRTSGTMLTAFPSACCGVPTFLSYGPGVYTPPVLMRKKPLQSTPLHTIICEPVQTAGNVLRAAGAEAVLIGVHMSVLGL